MKYLQAPSGPALLSGGLGFVYFEPLVINTYIRGKSSRSGVNRLYGAGGERRCPGVSLFFDKSGFARSESIHTPCGVLSHKHPGRMELTTEKIRRARSGDEEASREVILSARALAEKAHRSLARKVCRIDVSICLEDLLQDLAAKLQEERERWPPDYFRPWLIRVWKNLLIDRYREVIGVHQRRVDALPDEYGDDECTPLWLILDVRWACESSPETQREAIFHSIWQDMTYEEAAEALDTTKGSIRGRISRGYDRVREMLSAYKPPFDRP